MPGDSAYPLNAQLTVNRTTFHIHRSAEHSKVRRATILVRKVRIFGIGCAASAWSCLTGTAVSFNLLFSQARNALMH
jgi:hypothetical protein